jgi:ABC-type uncharacterized transport system substrate-binding protein
VLRAQPRHLGSQMFRQLARQLAKVFSGEKVGDVPVEQPTTFGLAINLQAAKAIGFESTSASVSNSPHARDLF